MAETEQIKSKSNRLSWILLIIALLLVVVFACIVLYMHKKSNQDKGDSSVIMSRPVLTFSPDNISMLDKESGQIEKQEVKISVSDKSTPAEIVEFELNNSDSSVNLQNNCLTASLEAKKAPCTLTVIWTVDGYNLNKENDVTVRYVLKGQSKDDKKNIYTAQIPVKLTSVKQVVEPEPIVEPEPKIEEKEEIVKEPEPVIEEPEEPDISEPEPEEIQPVKTKEEACYEFARPAYDLEGRPMGWIKADAGKYYFHPYSDLKCNAPTGEYDQFTGYIYSISNPKEQIGTDEASINANAKTSVVPNLSAPRFNARLNQSVEQSLNIDPAIASARRTAAETAISKRASENGADSSKVKGMIDAMQIKGTKNTKTDGLVPPSVKNGDQISSLPRNRKYVLRQFKPIPAVIVNDIRMDINTLSRTPVQAVVERNVYSDDERTIIIPTGTLLLGQVSSDKIPGRYTSVGSVEIEWYKFVRPDGAEFNFGKDSWKPFSGDAQGRIGVLGRGTNDYLQEFMFPLLTSLVPAAINMINPVTSQFVNQLDLDNNTVLLSGEQKSSEKAKAEIISAWNDVANKMVSDVLDSNVPPFTVPAGTRITVYSPKDLMLYVKTNSDGSDTGLTPNDNSGVFSPDGYTYAAKKYADGKGDSNESSYTISSENIYNSLKDSGLSNLNNAKEYAKQETQKEEAKKAEKEAAKQAKAESSSSVNSSGLKCSDGTSPDSNGCCTGETYEMIDGVPACCPADETADCFDPLK